MEERTRKKLLERARPGELKTVSFKVTEKKNYGLAPEVEIVAGWCPCTVCGHTYMHECEEADCQCCSSACT